MIGKNDTEENDRFVIRKRWGNIGLVQEIFFWWRMVYNLEK